MTWREIFACWHGMQAFIQSAASEPMRGQTNLEDKILLVALTPGWDRPWRTSKTWCRKSLGTSGREIPVEVSHRRRSSHVEKLKLQAGSLVPAQPLHVVVNGLCSRHCFVVRC